MSMMAIIMRTDVLQTIKDTLEEAQNIKVLSIYEKDNVVFGIYINDVRDSLSFLQVPRVHIETNVMGIQIEFFELGAVLHHIYYTGALKFIDILTESDENITPNNDLLTLTDFILENLPLNIAQVNFIESLNKERTFEYDDERIQSITFLRDVAITLLKYIELSDYKIELDFEFYYDDIKTESDYVKVYNQLNVFEQELKGIFFKKISNKNMSRINDMYVNIQLIHMKL